MQLTPAGTGPGQRFKTTCRIPLLALAFTLLCSATGHAVKISWKAVGNHSSAISLFRNSHATAGACLAKYHGLQKSGEKDSTLVATMWVYMQHCECDKPGKPTVWRIATVVRLC